MGLFNNSEGDITVKLDDSELFNVTFNDLTLREDCGKIDQAIDILDNTFLNKDEIS